MTQALSVEIERRITERTQAPPPVVGQTMGSGTRGQGGNVASSTLRGEWARETPGDNQNHLRMSEARFNFLHNKVAPLIEKADTCLRKALKFR